MLTPEQSRAYERVSVGAVAKLAAALDLGSSGETRESSSLSRPTKEFICSRGEVETVSDRANRLPYRGNK